MPQLDPKKKKNYFRMLCSNQNLIKMHTSDYLTFLNLKVMTNPSSPGCCTLTLWREQARSAQAASELSDCFFSKFTNCVPSQRVLDTGS